MPGDWTPSGPAKKGLRDALESAFDAPSLELLTADYFPLSHRFSRVSPEGFGKSFAFRLHELIEAARMDDWLVDLVAAAHERRPRNVEIGVIAEALGMTIAGPRLDNPTSDPFERIVQKNARFIEPVAFRERLSLLEGQVCWIEIPGGGGTGFLVGPDLILTNDHVIDDVRQGHVRWQDVRCRFDYKQTMAGAVPQLKGHTEVSLAAEWLAHRWPPSRYDWTPALGDAGPHEIDCALLRLAEPIGDMPIGGDTVDMHAEPRGWIDATCAPPTLIAGHQVLLLQHPEGEPLQLAIGTVMTFNASGTRLRYDVNSKHGSSGSPCLNADLQLVAVHHAHDLATPPAWNQAIPLQSIQRVWNDDSVAVFE